MGEAIAAVATGGSRSAIGVVRLSGAGCIAAVARVFTPDSGGVFGGGSPGRLTLGTLRDAQGRSLDRAMATFSLAPKSYTGEDTAELHCHGSPTVLALALEALFAQGVRQAGPGEFTKRAFLNGKLDLLEAEAVADLIDAQTPAAARCAAGRLEGALSRRVGQVYDGLVDLLAHYHAAVDYPDEDLAPFTPEEVGAALDRAAADLRALLETYERGRITREGVPCAIVGAPNVGKSTLLNALVGYERAIVTEVPGTTRDTVEETCVLGGVLLRLMDTAGIRDTDDKVERIGVERSRKAMEQAGLIFVVMDQSAPARQEDEALLKLAVSLAPTVAVLNKMDLPRGMAWTDELDIAPVCPVSAKTGRNLDALAELVSRQFPQGTEPPGELLSNARQAQAAGEALERLEDARAALAAGMPPDAPLMDVEEALAALGRLTGANLQEDVVERVFSRFCVGK